MTHLQIFQKVKTPDGIGTIININCPFNGLYYEEYKTTCVVWYGMDNVQSGLVACGYDYKTILGLNNSRKEKLDEIFGEENNNINMLDYLKSEIIRVSEKHFKRTHPSGMLNHLKLEVQELSDAIGKENEEEEWADCILLLLDAFRVRYGDDVSYNKLLHFALNKLDKVDKREWDSQPDENGVYHRKSKE